MSSPAETDLTVDANPTKRFFIEMLTRDLTTEDCILDLVDNSLHGHVRQTHVDVGELLWTGGGKTRAKRASVDITLDRDHLVIEDDCGGIDREDAQKSAFRLGALEAESGTHGLGVYGIGMKRAFFKLGNDIILQSKTKSDEYAIEIDVDTWAKEEKGPWHFAVSEKLPKGSKPLEKPGTRISIRNLRKPIVRAFDSGPFATDLAERAAKTYALFLRSGIQLSLNSKPLEPRLPEVGQTKEITPFKRRINEDGVQILVISGVVGEEGDAHDAGWYVFCNGRMVLEADRSTRTGWGRDFAEFHPKYNSFVGYMCFSSDSPEKLPWTTTKKDVVLEDKCYQAGLGEAITQSGKVIQFLNSMYRDQPDEAEIREVRDAATPVALTDLPAKESTFQYTPALARRPQSVNIQYRVKVKDVETIREHIGKPWLSARRIGQLTFDHYLQTECD